MEESPAAEEPLSPSPKQWHPSVAILFMAFAGFAEGQRRVGANT